MSSSTASKRAYRKEYAYNKVALTKPLCPSCTQPLNTISEEGCRNCHFSMAVVSPQFPFNAPALETVSDFVKYLSAQERGMYEASFAKITKKYPQFSFTLCLCDLDDRTNLREFGFWLLNACPEVKEGEGERTDSKVLVMFDTRKKKLSVTKGYAVEAYLPDDVLRDGLKGVHRFLLRAEHKNASAEVCKAFLKMLKQSGKEIKKRI